MSQRRSKIFGLVMFFAIMSTLLFIALKPEKKSIMMIKSISILNNHLLPENSYLRFAKLIDAKDFSEITFPIIESRLLKHPFVTDAEVEYAEMGDLRIKVEEKELIAVLISNGQVLWLTKQLQVLPQIPDINVLDLPIINYAKLGKRIEVLRYLQTEEIVAAREIIHLLKNYNKEILSALSEINLNDLDQITLTFSGIRPKIKFGSEDIIKKIIILENLWPLLKDESSEIGASDYVDLRLTNQIYIANLKNEK